MGQGLRRKQTLLQVRDSCITVCVCVSVFPVGVRAHAGAVPVDDLLDQYQTY